MVFLIHTLLTKNDKKIYSAIVNIYYNNNNFVIFFRLVAILASEFYMLAFRNTLFHLHRWCKPLHHLRSWTRQSVLKRRHVTFRRRGITQKKNTTFRTRRKYEIKSNNFNVSVVTLKVILRKRGKETIFFFIYETPLWCSKHNICKYSQSRMVVIVNIYT